MNLTPGQRLLGGEHRAYDVLGPWIETPHHAFCRARKPFWNYRHQDGRLYEAEADEALQVLIRIPRREAGQADLDLELECMARLGDGPGLPEVIDLFEPVDSGSETVPRLPVLVLADPHGDLLVDQLGTDANAAARRLRLLRESLVLLDALHQVGLHAGSAFDRSSIVIAPSGRWLTLGTDSIRPANSPDDTALDLRRWAALARPILGGIDADAGSLAATGDEFAWLAERLRRVEAGSATTIRDLMREDTGRGLSRIWNAVSARWSPRARPR
jgi:hypothetical protein